jgi:hypothetical protein
MLQRLPPVIEPFLPFQYRIEVAIPKRVAPGAAGSEKRGVPPFYQRRSPRSQLCPNQLPDPLFDLVRFRKAVERVLRKDLLSIQEDFERPGLAGSDGDPTEVVGVIMQQVLRQTGGAREIPSRRAVFDADEWFLGRGAGGHFFCLLCQATRQQLAPRRFRYVTRSSVAWNGKQRDSVFTSARAFADHRV